MDTGLYYYGARYYDPELARFIQADPVIPGDPAGNSQVLNRYTYCFNNPLRFTDMTGNEPDDTQKAKSKKVQEKTKTEVQNAKDPVGKNSSFDSGANKANDSDSFQGTGGLDTNSGTGSPGGKNTNTGDQKTNTGSASPQDKGDLKDEAVEFGKRVGRFVKKWLDKKDPFAGKKEVVDKLKEGSDKAKEDNLDKGGVGNATTSDFDGLKKGFEGYFEGSRHATEGAVDEAIKQKFGALLGDAVGKIKDGVVKEAMDIVSAWQESADPNS